MPGAVERDEDLMRTWLQGDWARIEEARRDGADIVFFDEFGLSYLETFGRTWAPRGQRPILRHVGADRQAESTGVGFTLSGRIRFRLGQPARRTASLRAGRRPPGSGDSFGHRASICRDGRDGRILRAVSP